MARVSSTRVIISAHEDLLHAPDAQFFIWQGRVEVVADPDLALSLPNVRGFRAGVNGTSRARG